MDYSIFFSLEKPYRPEGRTVQVQPNINTQQLDRAFGPNTTSLCKSLLEARNSLTVIENGWKDFPDLKEEIESQELQILRAKIERLRNELTGHSTANESFNVDAFIAAWHDANAIVNS